MTAPKGAAREAVTSVRDARVHYFQNPTPSGGTPALVRNFGAQRATGRFVHSACMIQREHVQTLGGYDAHILLNEDVDFFCRAIRAFGCEYGYGSPSYNLDDAASRAAHPPDVCLSLHALQEGASQPGSVETQAARESLIRRAGSRYGRRPNGGHSRRSVTTGPSST